MNKFVHNVNDRIRGWGVMSVAWSSTRVLNLCQCQCQWHIQTGRNAYVHRTGKDWEKARCAHSLLALAVLGHWKPFCVRIWITSGLSLKSKTGPGTSSAALRKKGWGGRRRAFFSWSPLCAEEPKQRIFFYPFLFVSWMFCGHIMADIISEIKNIDGISSIKWMIMLHAIDNM